MNNLEINHQRGSIIIYLDEYFLNNFCSFNQLRRLLKVIDLDDNRNGVKETLKNYFQIQSDRFRKKALETCHARKKHEHEASRFDKMIEITQGGGVVDG